MAIETYAVKSNVTSTTLLEVLELATSESVTVCAVLVCVDGGGIVEGVRSHVRYERCRHRHKLAGGGYSILSRTTRWLVIYTAVGGGRQLFEGSKQVERTKDAS